MAHCTALHYTALHCTKAALHYTTLHCTEAARCLICPFSSASSSHPLSVKLLLSDRCTDPLCRRLCRSTAAAALSSTAVRTSTPTL